MYICLSKIGFILLQQITAEGEYVESPKAKRAFLLPFNAHILNACRQREQQQSPTQANTQYQTNLPSLPCGHIGSLRQGDQQAESFQ